MKYIFWLASLIIIYIYLVYPFIVFLLSQLLKKKTRKNYYEPNISIIISAHNEEEYIGETIKNKLELNYPKDKIEIIVVSDASTDRTDEIVKEYANRGVRLIRKEPRQGKTSALNLAVSEANGEIIIFSDANSIYSPDALRELVANFSDPSVGYVTGKMVYVNPDGSLIGDGCSTYMKYENFLRKYESRIGSIVGVDGGIDAIRKSLYTPMRPDQLPDFVLPLKVIEKSYRVIYEPKAILQENTLNSAKDEYEMRIRVSLRSLWALYDMKHLLNPFKYNIFSWQLFSHKVLRYMVFLFLICLYVTNALLWPEGMFYKLLLIFQTIFYGTACMGLLTSKKEKNSRIIGLPYYFTLLNLAAGHAFLQFLQGKKQIIWKPRTG